MPLKSIFVVPKLTRSQFKKESRESSMLTRRLNLTTDLIRMGFHFGEVDAVFESMEAAAFLENADSEEGDGDLPPALNGTLLMKIIECVEAGEKGESASDQEAEEEMEEAAIVEREQEKEALEAIYCFGS